MEIEFAECVVCGKKQEWDWEMMSGWDFGVDIDDVEPDYDGGVRGTHLSCLDEGEDNDKAGLSS